MTSGSSKHIDNWNNRRHFTMNIHQWGVRPHLCRNSIWKITVASCQRSSGFQHCAGSLWKQQPLHRIIFCGWRNGDGKNVLIAYFSHTGNTEEVAGQIADLTGGTLAEIHRAEEYGDLQEEAEAEILEGVHPEITVSVDNVEDYDTIFVGYPKMEQGYICV